MRSSSEQALLRAPPHMLITDTLSLEDSALIEREAGSALQQLYLPTVHEPLPERFTALLEQLAVEELNGDPSSVAPT